MLLLVDSLTRYAMAQREVALALGEPPATRGYPPSVFGLLPLAESAGNGEGGAGSMSAIYTVLAGAMTSKTRWWTPRAPSWTVISCCRANWPSAATIRR